MTKRLVAVSGGVDSVVLLDMLARGDGQLVVAHVDHGIRLESGEDERFVRGLARKYQLPYVSTRLDLGQSASEEVARNGRYDFLVVQSEQLGAEIVTAHHRDDVVGSIAINLIRGTGWRGLAVMNRQGIVRPLLSWDKQRIYDYALDHHLEWTEDATNSSDVYLRNRLRASVLTLPAESTSQLLCLRDRQLQLASEIDEIAEQIRQQFASSRYAYTAVDEVVACELLRQEIASKSSYRPTLEQTHRVLLAIKTARPGSRVDVAQGISIGLHAREFVVETTPEVVN